MAATAVSIVELVDSSDARGSSFSPDAAWLEDGFALRDLHVVTVLPGKVRGNHFHAERREILVVQYADRWTLFWDSGADTDVQTKQFEGQGSAVLEVAPNAAHAIRNDGERVLHVVGLSDAWYDPTAPDAFPRQVSQQ
jgi:dTDP-4-dehydrorhamnose 3,5-epimerase-like enzyme